jgi:putative SOS response-associated peptidase YedK
MLSAMCGRISLTCEDLRELADELAAETVPGEEVLHRARYNAGPSSVLWQLRRGSGGRLLQAATWGLLGGRDTQPRLLINARAETASRLPAFRDGMAHRRCVIPVDGFFEWVGPRQARRPLWFRPADGRLLLLAGIYDEPANERHPRFTILTTTANRAVRVAHHRMPVVIPPDRLDEWLDAGASHLLRPAPDDLLSATPVSPRVNDVANDDPACLAPPPPEAPPEPHRAPPRRRRVEDDRQGKLF